LSQRSKEISGERRKEHYVRTVHGTEVSEVKFHAGGRRCIEAWKSIESVRADRKQVPLEPISGKRMKNTTESY
jgi:hypothetical protein